MKSTLIPILVLIMLTACGSNSSDSLEDKQNIVILQNIPAGVCESPEYSVALEAIGFNDYITKETSEDVSCEDYGKSTQDGNCAIIPYYSTLKDTVNCVIGYNPSHEDISKIPNGK